MHLQATCFLKSLRGKLALKEAMFKLQFSLSVTLVMSPPQPNGVNLVVNRIQRSGAQVHTEARWTPS